MVLPHVFVVELKRSSSGLFGSVSRFGIESFVQVGVSSVYYVFLWGGVRGSLVYRDNSIAVGLRLLGSILRVF